ncbi:exosortase F system-associated membrane protein [Chryseolinea lacunae]|uniref:Exosortase F system-associated protein n=1 Tax=Chryseolinea lacunae TaxID=2801331 RepID=A0ABS1L0A2_9BACT|nr:exosortase F system-associated protein [Chryseolinea lacunae]MBL0744006.1 exosortase F system-associated protein [Chryseolinea lacunae]
MSPGYRKIIGVFSVAGMVLVFLFQRVDVAAWFGMGGSHLSHFLVNRTIRFLLNDALAIALIYALFVERKYLVFAVYVQVTGLVVFLLPYFILKVYFPFYNGPLISFLHRLVLNPTLLMLLIPAFYYQKYKAPTEEK